MLIQQVIRHIEGRKQQQGTEDISRVDVVLEISSRETKPHRGCKDDQWSCFGPWTLDGMTNL